MVMKKNTLLVIIICSIASIIAILAVFIIGAVMTNNQMHNTAKQAQCTNIGGVWQNGECLK